VSLGCCAGGKKEFATEGKGHHSKKEKGSSLPKGGTTLNLRKRRARNFVSREDPLILGGPRWRESRKGRTAAWHNVWIHGKGGGARFQEKSPLSDRGRGV